jgi:predicted phosphohydrolase
VSSTGIITDAHDAHETSNAEENSNMKFTSVNLEKEKATASMKASFYKILELEYNRMKASGSCMIKKEEYDEFVTMLHQYPNVKKKSQRKLNAWKRYCIHSNIDGESLYCKQEKNLQ